MPTAIAPGSSTSRMEQGGARPEGSRVDGSRSGSVGSTWGRLVGAANNPVSGESVAVFRILFGLLIAASSARFLAKGWVDALYLSPANHLTYPGFDWVRPWPAPLMHAHVAVLGLLGLLIAVGYRTRMVAGIFTLGFAYVELIDAALYLNHYWYVTLVGGLLVVLPTAGNWSFDGRSGRVSQQATVPVGVIWVLRAQLAVVYLFAGLAKLNEDWLAGAMPMRLWLADSTWVPLIGPLLDEPVVALAASWSGAVFDCTIVAWLLWPKTRKWAYVAVVGFHLFTGALFQIGVFPWVMIAGTLIFFEPAWPTDLIGRFTQRNIEIPTTTPIVVGVEGRARLSPGVIALLVILATAQILVPLRHVAYPGNVRWTEEGYYGSWRVMLTEKAGHLEFNVTNPATNETWTVGPEVVLTEWQATQAAVRPDLLLTAAHLLADHYDSLGVANVEVRAVAHVSMNGRPAQLIVDPKVDLAAQSRVSRRAFWIVPLGGGER